MKISRVILAVALVAAFATTGMCATKTMTSNAMPGGIVADVSQATVKVVGVNQTARTLTLQMPNGKTMTYKVGKDVKNFAMIKRGDLIKATLLDSLAVYVEKKGGKPTATESATVMLAPKGAMPGMIVANTYRVTGKIQVVDMQNRTVTITGPNYMSKTFKVGSNVKSLRNLKAGDDVVIRYTEAMALDVQKPKKK